MDPGVHSKNNLDRGDAERDGYTIEWRVRDRPKLRPVRQYAMFPNAKVILKIRLALWVVDGGLSKW